MNKPSPTAALVLLGAIAADSSSVHDVDELLGVTDCPQGCVVEPDGHCPHGYESAGLTAEVI
jgi:hypothetical protein